MVAHGAVAPPHVACGAFQCHRSAFMTSPLVLIRKIHRPFSNTVGSVLALPAVVLTFEQVCGLAML
jgi:hypothetical protein